LDDALARLSVEASNSSAAALHRHHQQQNQRSSALSSSSLEGQHPTRRLPLTRKSVLECAHPAPPPPYAGTERFLPTRNQNPNLPQEADGKAAAAAAAHAVATAALGGTKLGAHLPPWEAGPGLLWNGDSLVSRAPHAEARHGQVCDYFSLHPRRCTVSSMLYIYILDILFTFLNYFFSNGAFLSFCIMMMLFLHVRLFPP